ncbi:hypothetical protein MASR2M15_13340 [Anaerolineales bacterium]
MHLNESTGQFLFDIIIELMEEYDLDAQSFFKLSPSLGLSPEDLQIGLEWSLNQSLIEVMPVPKIEIH